MANLPVIDMVRTGQNIGRLRKQAGLSVKDLQGIFGFATPQGHLQVAAGSCPADTGQSGSAGSGSAGAHG